MAAIIANLVFVSSIYEIVSSEDDFAFYWIWKQDLDTCDEQLWEG